NMESGPAQSGTEELVAPLYQTSYRAPEHRLCRGYRLRRADMHPDAIEAQAEQSPCGAGAIEQAGQRKRALRGVREQRRREDCRPGIDERHHFVFAAPPQPPVSEHAVIAAPLISEAADAPTQQQ